MPQPKQLSDIELDEVTVCEEPANDDCRAAIVKSRTQANPLEENDMPQANQNVEDVNDQDDLDLDFDDETLNAVAEQLDELGDDAVPFVAALMAGVEEAGDVITKMAADMEELSGEHEELKKSAGLLVERIEKMGADGKIGETEQDLVSAIRKSMGGAELPPEVAVRIDALEAVAKSAAEAEAVAKAKAFGVGDPKELGPILIKVRKSCGAEVADKIESVLTSAGAAIKKSKVFTRVGVDTGADASDPVRKSLSEAEVGAEEIRKSNPHLTKEQALTQFWQQNPAKYEEYREAQRAA